MAVIQISAPRAPTREQAPRAAMQPPAPVAARVSAGPERFILALALCVPLGLVVFALGQFTSINLGTPSTVMSDSTTSSQLAPYRIAPRDAAPPPTLAPRPTAVPTAVPTPAARSTVVPVRGDTYTVKPGDELKHIAAQYKISIWKIIESNDIPDPDSLRVGQVLKIPSD